MSIPRGIRPVTWEDALRLPDGERFEVINGELMERKSSFLASTIAGRIGATLSGWARGGHSGTVAGADGGYTIFPWSPGDVRMPDASYISKARLPRTAERYWAHVAPELVVEVVCPDDYFLDVESEASDWIRAGVDLVWVVVPNTRSVHVWRKDGSRAVLQSGEVLSGESVLPGLSIPVANLFEDNEEPAD